MDTESIIKGSYSINDVCMNVYGYCNGRVMKKIKKYINDNDIDTSHFSNKNLIYERLIKECEVCGSEFEVRSGHKKEKTTCSVKCSNTYFRSNKDIKTRGKISKSLKKYYKENVKKYGKCKICGNEYERWRTPSGKLTNSKVCSKECRYEIKSRNSKRVMRDLIKNKKHKGWRSRNTRSYPERFFERVLNRNKILNSCIVEHSIPQSSLGLDNNYNYFIDFYFHDKRLCLEIDGKQHEESDRKNHDDIRDHLLKKSGYRVYRIKWRSINKKEGKEYIKKEIDKFIEYYNKI